MKKYWKQKHLPKMIISSNSELSFLKKRLQLSSSNENHKGFIKKQHNVKTLVLDMDETLLYASEIAIPIYDFKVNVI